MHLCDGPRFVFEHGDDRGRTHPQDPDEIAHATALERQGDARLLHGQQPPFGAGLSENNGAWTGRIVTAIALGALGLLPVLYSIGTVTIGTVALHKSHRISPTRRYGMCAQS